MAEQEVKIDKSSALELVEGKEVMEEYDEEDEGSTDDESEGDDSEEEEEPMLKYDRMCNDLKTIFSKDCASCMAVHPKFLALGTHWGTIHILDHMGDNIGKEIHAHTTSVNQISIDENGDYIASCSDDGNVVIIGLYDQENNMKISYDRPVKAVALSPDYYKPNSGKTFVTGDDKLVFNERGLFNRNKSTVIHQGEGAIRNIKWRSHFIAWSNDIGVKVYDVSSRKRITNIARDHNPKLRPEIFRCNICWKDDRTFLIGWGDSIKTCVIRERVNDVKDLPSRYVEIVSVVRTDFYVCGMSPLGDNIIALTYEVENENGDQGPSSNPDELPKAKRPQLRIFRSDDYEELSNEALSIRGFEIYKCNDYHLESLIEEKIYFIVSPKDIVVARLRDLDDHVSWLLDHHRFEEAMASATEHSKELKRHDIQIIGRYYLDYLFDQQKYDEAARTCVRVLGRKADLWEEEVYKFSLSHQLKAIAPYLPRGEPKLDPAVYEMVLNEFLQTNVERFEKLIKDWPSHLYNIKTIIYAVTDKLKQSRPDNKILLKCLAELYILDTQYERALQIYLRLQHPNAFDLIHRHNLFDSISDKIVMLMRFDSKMAVTLLLDHMERIPIEMVVKQLKDAPDLLHVYLDAVYQKDPNISSNYHGQQVVLYAEYEPAKLLPFLRSSSHIPLQKALMECKQRNLTSEMVFLLGHMGNRKEALLLITNELRDVDQAIEFCKEHDDMDLWTDLIEHAIDKPAFIKSLLNNIGTHVDPIHLINKIPPNMEITGLRDSLVKILQDFNLQINLREGCQRILVSDCYNLMERLVNRQKRGICIEESQVCQVCHTPVIVDDLRYASNLIVFFCKHAFHEECLPAHALDSCSICSSQKRKPGQHFQP